MAAPDRNDPEPQQALAAALSAVLRPSARLAVSSGLPFAQAAELFKRAFVEAAQGDSAAGRVSRISTATGLNRREVTRLLAAQPRTAAIRSRSIAAEVFAHWTTAPEFRTKRGTPRALPRQGPGASFEALAQAVTTDVHPRSILEELMRLGLARHDAARDTVALVKDAYVPRGDALRMLGFLGDNVGDHLEAAVDNVLGDGRRHFEQAVFADDLSDESMAQVRALVTTQWKLLIEAMVPALERMIENDQHLGRTRDQRLRIGLYTFNAGVPTAPTASPSRPTRLRRSKDAT